MEENANKLHFKRTDFNPSTHVTVSLCLNRIFELFKHTKALHSSIKCGWLRKEPVGHSECSK